MANQSNPHLRSHYAFAARSLTCLITFILLVQGPILLADAEPNQYQMAMQPNSRLRANATTLTTTAAAASNNDDLAYDAGPDIYDDNNEESAEAATSSTSSSQSKLAPTKTTRAPAVAEDAHKQDYEDQDAYANEAGEDETTNPDDVQAFGDTKSGNTASVKPDLFDPNMRKGSEVSSTSRMPFLPTYLWHDLFSKPGILVGIIGGVVIGMLSAILLVMFIIYRMRKKDEGSYALEEGPRKSPSHAYTRVSSREFFA